MNTTTVAVSPISPLLMEPPPRSAGRAGATRVKDGGGDEERNDGLDARLKNDMWRGSFSIYYLRIDFLHGCSCWWWRR